MSQAQALALPPTHTTMATPTLSSPWKKRDAWRYEGVFSKANRFRGIFPGFYVGLGAFLAYSIYEDYFAPKPEQHH